VVGKYSPLLENGAEGVTWAVFKREFLTNYFSKDVRGKNAAKFIELVKFYPHYNAETAEFSKCIKFENGLCAYIKRAIGYQKIRQFSELVSTCRVYEEDIKAHYKIMNELKGKQQQGRGKPYSAPADKGEQWVNDESGPRKRDTPTEIVCFQCGGKGHKSNACSGDVKRCFRCGRKGHTIADCKHDDIVCFNCGEEGHISPRCKQP